jgi:hypothetical protein
VAIITSTVKVGQGPSKEEWVRIKAELREAKRYPIVYDEDSPKLTPAQLAEFKPVDGTTWEERTKTLAAKRVGRKRQPVAIRLVPEGQAEGGNFQTLENSRFGRNIPPGETSASYFTAP